MTKSYQIIPNFTEDLVGFMVQSMLTIARFPRAPFAMIPFSKKEERIYGADVKIDSICPLYIQFKRSLAYPNYSTAKIIKDRKKLKANYSPNTLYFELRAKKPMHKDFQHNILFDLKTNLEKADKGKAFYTAPLFFNRTAYLLAVHMSSLLSWRPWSWYRHDPFLKQSQNILTQTGSINFKDIPILREHIVIPPHAKVTTHKHQYSYLESGKEICFHSPSLLNNEHNLGQTIDDFLQLRDGQPTTEMINLNDSNKLLTDLGEEKILGKETNSDEHIIDRWLDFGKILWDDYEIFQFMLIKFNNEFNPLAKAK